VKVSQTFLVYCNDDVRDDEKILLIDVFFDSVM